MTSSESALSDLSSMRAAEHHRYLQAVLLL